MTKLPHALMRRRAMLDLMKRLSQWTADANDLYDKNLELNDEFDVSSLIPMSFDEWAVEVSAWLEDHDWKPKYGDMLRFYADAWPKGDSDYGNDSDYGSDRQIAAENTFFDALSLAGVDVSEASAFSAYALKATTEEYLAYAWELYGDIE